MARPTLQPGEEVLAQESVQLAKGFPQTAGRLYLTNRRLLLDPDQLMSLGCGRPLEIPLAQIRLIDKAGRFQGGTFIGGAGRKIEVGLADGSVHTFSFFLNSDIDAFYDALAHRMAQRADSSRSENDAPLETGRLPKPKRTLWFWLMVAAVAAVVTLTFHDWIDFIRQR